MTRPFTPLPVSSLLSPILNNERLVWVGLTALFYWQSLSDLQRPERRKLFAKIRPFTLVSYARLVSLWEILEEVERKALPGAFVECGVWKGGAAAVMAHFAQRDGVRRTVHLFDSFAGMPEPTAEDGERARTFAGNAASGRLETVQKTVGSLEVVKRLFFEILMLEKRGVSFHKGWFQHAIARVKADVGSIAVLRVDADWYTSVKTCLHELYDQVVSGGYIIFDDYGYWPGCRKAVDEFRKEREIRSQLVRTDFSGAYFMKE